MGQKARPVGLDVFWFRTKICDQQGKFLGPKARPAGCCLSLGRTRFSTQKFGVKGQSSWVQKRVRLGVASVLAGRAVRPKTLPRGYNNSCIRKTRPAISGMPPSPTRVTRSPTLPSPAVCPPQACRAHPATPPRAFPFAPHGPRHCAPAFFSSPSPLHRVSTGATGPTTKTCNCRPPGQTPNLLSSLEIIYFLYQYHAIRILHDFPRISLNLLFSS